MLRAEYNAYLFLFTVELHPYVHLGVVWLMVVLMEPSSQLYSFLKQLTSGANLKAIAKLFVSLDA